MTKKALHNRFGGFLKGLRDLAKLSIGEAAPLLGIDSGELADIEEGLSLPNHETAEKMTFVYRIPSEEFLLIVERERRLLSTHEKN